MVELFPTTRFEVHWAFNHFKSPNKSRFLSHSPSSAQSESPKSQILADWTTLAQFWLDILPDSDAFFHQTKTKIVSKSENEFFRIDSLPDPNLFSSTNVQFSRNSGSSVRQRQIKNFSQPQISVQNRKLQCFRDPRTPSKPRKQSMYTSSRLQWYLLYMKNAGAAGTIILGVFFFYFG